MGDDWEAGAALVELLQPGVTEPTDRARVGGVVLARSFRRVREFLGD